MDIVSAVDQLRGESESQRTDAAHWFLARPDLAAHAGADLIRALRSASEELVEVVVGVLEEIEPRSDDLQAFINLAGDRQELLAYWAITMLGRLGESANSATQCLAQSLQLSSFLSVRQKAAWALGRVTELCDEAKTALQSAAQSDDSRTVRLATIALEKHHAAV